jgi:uncharacterized protein YndB with AHSA1/START domain
VNCCIFKLQKIIIMTTTTKTNITVEVRINAPVEKVWHLWTDPIHIIHWNSASDDWYTPWAENDLRVGGKFLSRMESKDGNMGFDFTGEYSKVHPYRQINYRIADGREVKVSFASEENHTKIAESFETEQTHPVEMQRTGWQAILNNFKKYAETADKTEVLHFEININAPVEKVYKNMLDKKTYSAWTAEFNPASRFEGSWEKRSRILFLGADQDGSVGGMVSYIRENIPGKFVSIEHLGMVKSGKEILSGPEIDGWAGALENYTFTSGKDHTLLSVDMDANQEFIAYFLETWPRALKKLKTISET